MSVVFKTRLPEAPNFAPSEFFCRDGCGYNVTRVSLVCRLQVARWYSKIPYIITSGSRCPAKDASVSKSKNQTHRKGHAADISTDPAALARLGVHLTENEIRGLIIAGLVFAWFKRIGIAFGDHFIHADDYRWAKAQRPIIWGYDK